MNQPKPDTAVHGPARGRAFHADCAGAGRRAAGRLSRRRGRGGRGRPRRRLQPALRRAVRRDRGGPGRQAAVGRRAERSGALERRPLPPPRRASWSSRSPFCRRRNGRGRGRLGRGALPRAVRGGADRRLPDRRPRPRRLQQPALADLDGADPGGGPGLRLGPGRSTRTTGPHCSTHWRRTIATGDGPWLRRHRFLRRRARCGGCTPGRRRFVVGDGELPATSARSRTSPIRCGPKQSLRDSEERLRPVVQNMHLGVTVAMGRRRSRAGERGGAGACIGLTEDRLLGKTSFDPQWDVVPRTSRLPVAEYPVPMAIRTGRPVHDWRWASPDRKTRDRVWRWPRRPAIRRRRPGPAGALCSFSDITARKRSPTRSGRGWSGRCRRRSGWRAWACWPAAWPTTSTTS